MDNVSRWRDPRYDYDGIQRAEQRRQEAAKAERIVRLIARSPAARDRLLAALAPGIVAMIQAAGEEGRR